MNIQDWFHLVLTGLISLKYNRLSTVFFSTTIQKQFFCVQLTLWTNSHICMWLLEKLYLWLYGPLLAKWCLYFLIHDLSLSQLSFQEASILQFHSCSHLLQEFWSQIKSVTAFTFTPFICHEEMGLDVMILDFLMLRFKSVRGELKSPFT